MQGVTSVYHTGVTESQTVRLSHDPNFSLTTVDAVPSQTCIIKVGHGPFLDLNISLTN